MRVALREPPLGVVAHERRDAAQEQAANAILLKVNQVGTVSEALDQQRQSSAVVSGVTAEQIEQESVASAPLVDAAHGDFRVNDGSPALKLGFVNFPMDQFGVQKPELKKIAKTPALPGTQTQVAETSRPAPSKSRATRNRASGCGADASRRSA